MDQLVEKKRDGPYFLVVAYPVADLMRIVD